MCLLIVVSRVVPGAPLVVAANRDERLERPAEPMVVLRDTAPHTIGGRDLAAGGTWLAVNEHGVVAGLTNRPQLDGSDPAKRSRGELPLALTAGRTAAEGVDELLARHRPADYNPAWLLVGDRTSLLGVDFAGDEATVVELPPGIHVLENRPLGEASPKLDRVRHLLAGIDALPVPDVVTRLQVVMADHQPTAVPADTPEEHHDIARAVGAVCVHTTIEGKDYGTRWSGIVTIAEEASAPPTVRYTGGPPCTTSFRAT